LFEARDGKQILNTEQS